MRGRVVRAPSIGVSPQLVRFLLPVAVAATSAEDWPKNKIMRVWLNCLCETTRGVVCNRSGKGASAMAEIRVR